MGTSRRSPWLRLETLRTWLKQEYLKTLNACTLDQFTTIINTHLEVSIPADVLATRVFNPCPRVEGDELGELRYLNDLGAALKIWMGFGLWPRGVGLVVDQLLPHGPVRNLAMVMLNDEFAKLDASNIGVLQPAHVIMLLHRLIHPGLTNHGFAEMMRVRLNLDVPDRELLKYFMLMDVNGDGVLSSGEFISTMRFAVIDFFPQHILNNMNLSVAQILSFICMILLNIAAFFAFVTLVIRAFTAGGAVASGIHSIVSTLGGLTAKTSSDSSSGNNDNPAQIRAFLETQLMDSIVLAMGLSRDVIDRLSKL